MPNMEGVKCVLLDIEGTICPISFVKETLFPYALKALPDVLASKWDDLDFQEYRDAFPESERSSKEDLLAHVEDLTKRDVKIAPLKNLQGYLWENGYKTGAYSTPLFPDVAPRLKQWKNEGLELAIYSSGSVFAQKLLFGHVNTENVATGHKRKRTTDADSEDVKQTNGIPPKKRAMISEDSETKNEVRKGSTRPDVANDAAPVLDNDIATEDLQHLISAWFDTTNAGLKTESTSYKQIADTLQSAPSDMLFLSDNVKELDAAAEAGMHSIMVDRPGNAPLSALDKDRLRTVHSLDEIRLAQEKRKSKKPRRSERPAQRQSQMLRSRITPAE